MVQAACMRMHAHLAEAAAAVAKSVLREHRVLDHTLAKVFEAHPRWGKRDRHFVAETVFEVARWRRALGFLVDSEETDALCAAQWTRMGYDLPNGWTYRGAGAGEIRQREALLPQQPRAVRESVPDWLDEVGMAQLGDRWALELSALNQRARVFLRVNTLKIEVSEALGWLEAQGVAATPVPGVPEALVLPEGKMLPKPLRQTGLVEIQDAGSQTISPLLGALPGERVIDACSGAGGKALHLAALMRNQGKIYAMDVEPRKLDELAKRAKRASASCIAPKPISDTTPQDFANVADRLLIDAPCSGLGTLKRQPDLKWRLKPAALDRTCAIQRELLLHYPAMLKPGGMLVYATCSILPSENRHAVDSLLDTGGFELISEHPVSPADSGFDGFYAAVLRKLA